MLKEGLTALGKNSRQGPRFAACLPERDAVERFLQSLGPHVITWCGTGLSGWKGWEGKMCCGGKSIILCIKNFYPRKSVLLNFIYMTP